MGKAVTLALSLILALSIIVTVGADETVYYSSGDVNMDGVTDSLDAVMILRYDAELTELSEEQLFLGDVNGDDEVDSLDAVMVLRYDAELIDEFPRTSFVSHTTISGFEPCY